MNKLKNILIFTLVLSLPGFVSAQGMMYPFASAAPSVQVDQTAQDEASGKVIFDKLQAKQVQCSQLKDDDFDVLGDYFMGQMMGSAHAAMNVRLEQQLGSDGEKQMHVVMGKRLSGCDPTLTYLASGASFMLAMMGGGANMMNWGYGGYGMPYAGGWMGGLFMILWWVLIIAAIVSLIKWLRHGNNHGHRGNSALDILKERYAKGEITKQEFEEKKKDVL
jgi:putative membrane protein